MSARSFRPEFDQSRHDIAQTGGDYYAEMAQRVLIPRIVERNKQVLNVAPTYFHFYQRASHGRRCSCFSNNETSPSATCLVCFRTGNTAGYQMYGHVTDVFDATARSAAVGIVQDFDTLTRPTQFRLAKCARRGHIDFQWNPVGGTNVCSLVSLHAQAPRGTRVRAECRLFSESAFVPLSQDALSARIGPSQTTGGIHLRVTMERDSISAVSPRFSHLRLRHRVLDDDRIPGDVPAAGAGTRASEFGTFEDVDARPMFIDSRLRAVTNEDLFREVGTGRLWRIYRAKPVAPADILTSWELETRLVVNADFYANIL